MLYRFCFYDPQAEVNLLVNALMLYSHNRYFPNVANRAFANTN